MVSQKPPLACNDVERGNPLANGKAIIFSRLSNRDVGSGHSLDTIKSKLRQFAIRSELDVIREFECVEDLDFGHSQTLSAVLDYVDGIPDNVVIISYHSTNYDNKHEIGNRLQEFIGKQKVVIKNYCHPCFREPPDDNAKTWRYLNLVKFIDLIQSGTLFFTRADNLRSMDKFEGSALTNFSKQINLLLSEKKISLPPDFAIPLDAYLDIQNRREAYNEQTWIRQNFINCWHIADFENFAMWKIYSDTFGVCIQSTFQSLCNSFSDDYWGFYDDKRKIYVGEVTYINRQASMIPQDNMFWPYMHKGIEFAYERELRCIVWDLNSAKDNIKIKIDLENLIHRVFISPFAPEWFKAVVENLCLKYGIDSTKIHQSTLK
jgi:hypothetical protein